MMYLCLVLDILGCLAFKPYKEVIHNLRSELNQAFLSSAQIERRLEAQKKAEEHQQEHSEEYFRIAVDLQCHSATLQKFFAPIKNSNSKKKECCWTPHGVHKDFKKTYLLIHKSMTLEELEKACREAVRSKLLLVRKEVDILEWMHKDEGLLDAAKRLGFSQDNVERFGQLFPPSMDLREVKRIFEQELSEEVQRNVARLFDDYAKDLQTLQKFSVTLNLWTYDRDDPESQIKSTAQSITSLARQMGINPKTSTFEQLLQGTLDTTGTSNISGVVKDPAAVYTDENGIKTPHNIAGVQTIILPRITAVKKDAAGTIVSTRLIQPGSGADQPAAQEQRGMDLHYLEVYIAKVAG